MKVRRLGVTLLEVSERENGVVVVHLPIGPLKTRHSHCAIGAGSKMMFKMCQYIWRVLKRFFLLKNKQKLNKTKRALIQS